MLTCWNEEPEKRLPFSKLRSKFDAMLLADNKNHYIELQMNSSKFRKLTPVTTQNEGACGSTRSLNTEHREESKSAGHSPSHWPHCSTEGENKVGSKQHLVPHEACRDIERKDQASDSAKRPIGVHIPHHDQNKLNPYVDSPSRMASTSFVLSASDLGSSNEAIEMKQL